MEKTIQEKTEITDVTLIDLLVVCKGLPKDEIEQIEAFTGIGMISPLCVP